MMRIWIAVLPVLLLLAGCGGEKDAGYVARKLDIVLPQPAAVTSGDSHGGFHGDFHGDGLLHMELTFSQEDALAVEEAVSSAGWSLFPMEPELEERLYPDGAGLARASPGMVVSGGPSGGRDGGYVAAVLLQLYLCGL